MFLIINMNELVMVDELFECRNDKLQILNYENRKIQNISVFFVAK